MFDLVEMHRERERERDAPISKLAPHRDAPISKLADILITYLSAMVFKPQIPMLILI